MLKQQFKTAYTPDGQNANTNPWLNVLGMKPASTPAIRKVGVAWKQGNEWNFVGLLKKPAAHSKYMTCHQLGIYKFGGLFYISMAN
jgi:hypothetical protein